MKINLKYISIFAIGSSLVLTSCFKSEDSPGYEYMPDMYRSQAIEAYVDYGMVKDDELSEAALERKKTISARVPAEGSIPFYSNHNKAELFMPYTYENTNEGYVASANNQIPSVFLEDVKGNVKEGKRLYNIMCQHCHGMKGQGDGGVVEVGDFNPPSPYNGAYKDRTLGTIFHVITFGKGAMGAHSSQLNKEERWKVAMYVRTLQHDGDFKLDELKGEKKEISFASISTEEVAKMNAGSKISLRNVYFTSGSSNLSKESDAELNKLVQLMKEIPTMTIEVAGHTDNSGDAQKNSELSNLRAGSVVEQLVKQGIDKKRVVAKGYGSEFPVADNTTESSKKLNRRIEFEILSK